MTALNAQLARVLMDDRLRSALGPRYGQARTYSPPRVREILPPAGLRLDTASGDRAAICVAAANPTSRSARTAASSL